MKQVCPECGYNAGENGEKILLLHMSAQHGSGSPLLSPEMIAALNRENDVVIARTSLVIGSVLFLLGLGAAYAGYTTFSVLTCSSNICFTPQDIVNQLRASGFAAVYTGAQETVFGGLLLSVFGVMGVAQYVAQRLGLVSKLQIVLLVGIFSLVLVTVLSLAGGIIPFGQRIRPPAF